MTYKVLMGTLNPTLSLTRCKRCWCVVWCDAGVSGACGWRNSRRGSRRHAATGHSRVVFGGSVIGGIGACRHHGADSHRQGSDDTAAARAGTARSQVSATRAAAAAAAAAAEQRRSRSHERAAAMHAAQLCQHEERAHAHDHLQRGHELHR